MHRALHDAGLMTYDEDNKLVIDTAADTSVDEIGLIYEPTGETTTEHDDGTGEDIEVPVMAAVHDGAYHANVRTANQEIAEALAAVAIDTPNSPHRIWA